MLLFSFSTLGWRDAKCYEQLSLKTTEVIGKCDRITLSGCVCVCEYEMLCLSCRVRERKLMASPPLSPLTRIISLFLSFYHSISLSFSSQCRSHPLSCHFRDRAISSPGVDRAISLSTRSLNSRQHYHSAAHQFISWFAIKKKAGAIKLDSEVLHSALWKCGRITLTGLFSLRLTGCRIGDGSVQCCLGLVRPVSPRVCASPL